MSVRCPHVGVLLSLVFATVGFIACGSGGAGTLTTVDPDGGASGDATNERAASNDARADAVAADGAAGCRSSSECKQGFESCVAPDEPQCGGAALPEECSNDASCADAGADFICLRGSCSGSRCVPKCTGDQQCSSTPAGLAVCDAGSGRCIPKACPTACPTNYVCSPNAVEGCVRKTCTSDAECNGACVNNRCWAGAGRCLDLPS